eukprot:9387431-Pyramimonas_sp.AAC.1
MGHSGSHQVRGRPCSEGGGHLQAAEGALPSHRPGLRDLAREVAAPQGVKWPAGQVITGNDLAEALAGSTADIGLPHGESERRLG